MSMYNRTEDNKYWRPLHRDYSKFQVSERGDLTPQHFQMGKPGTTLSDGDKAQVQYEDNFQMQIDFWDLLENCVPERNEQQFNKNIPSALLKRRKKFEACENRFSPMLAFDFTEEDCFIKSPESNSSDDDTSIDDVTVMPAFSVKSELFNWEKRDPFEVVKSSLHETAQESKPWIDSEHETPEIWTEEHNLLHSENSYIFCENKKEYYDDHYKQLASRRNKVFLPLLKVYNFQKTPWCILNTAPETAIQNNLKSPNQTTHKNKKPCKWNTPYDDFLTFSLCKNKTQQPETLNFSNESINICNMAPHTRNNKPYRNFNSNANIEKSTDEYKTKLRKTFYKEPYFAERSDAQAQTTIDNAYGVPFISSQPPSEVFSYHSRGFIVPFVKKLLQKLDEQNHIKCDSSNRNVQLTTQGQEKEFENENEIHDCLSDILKEHDLSEPYPYNYCDDFTPIPSEQEHNDDTSNMVRSESLLSDLTDDSRVQIKRAAAANTSVPYEYDNEFEFIIPEALKPLHVQQPNKVILNKNAISRVFGLDSQQHTDDCKSNVAPILSQPSAVLTQVSSLPPVCGVQSEESSCKSVQSIIFCEKQDLRLYPSDSGFKPPETVPKLSDVHESRKNHSNTMEPSRPNVIDFKSLVPQNRNILNTYWKSDGVFTQRKSVIGVRSTLSSRSLKENGRNQQEWNRKETKSENNALNFREGFIARLCGQIFTGLG